MTLESKRALRRHRGMVRLFATGVEPVKLESAVDAERQERAVIRAPTALEVVQRDRSRRMSS
jgi:hypothetical protein